ncbi:hypothetical protein FD16_GL002402 [Paucilactobacillus suebicus DSM 5007 = KCTC 3549]|uniref:Uncharacterized protein n=2 Tax=Paucilactobacillus suebicus TaxID=152335 RepID=A0A0R1W413_9LACO|nr:hypothetical protein FD16_GL002402 [Paucilactobacillus suebicus DSM 5007 = KCTC 3549]
MLKLINVNHRHIRNSQVVVTDEAGKPNALLTDLLRDVINSINIFVNINDTYSVDELVDALTVHTPLPDDVLEEYEKILGQEILGINFATRKGQIEFILER